MTHEHRLRPAACATSTAVAAVFAWMSICLSGCAAKDNAAMVGLNNKFDHLIEFQSSMRDDLRQYHEEGSKQDKRMATLLDTVHIEIGSAAVKLAELHTTARDMSAKVAEIKTDVGAVRQQFGSFKGKQNVGWFSGGGLWAALVAVAAFYLIPSPLQRRSRKTGRKTP